MNTRPTTLTPEQQEIRSKGIGSSEIAAIAGLSPWARPIDVYLRKLGLVEDEVNPNMERGIYLEPSIADWYAGRTGATLTDVGTLVHTEHPLVRATPDREATSADDRWCLEIKSPSFRTAHHWGEPGTDEIPDYYVPQVIWEMACMGVERADVAALLGGDLAIYTVQWDQGLFDELRKIAEAFWTDHIVPKIPPEPEGSRSYSDYLVKRFPSNTRAELLESNGEIEEAIHSLKEAKERIGEAETDKKAAENLIKSFIGDQDGVRGPWGKITWRNNKPGSKTDWKMVASAAGATDEDIAQYTTEKPGARVFRPSFTK